MEEIVRKIFVLLFVLVCTSFVFAENHWIAFNNFDGLSHQTLFLIDDAGNVLTDPVSVLDASGSAFWVTASLGVDSNGRPRLFLNDFSDENNPRILSSLLDLDDLTASTPAPFGATQRGELSQYYIHATQTTDRPFVVFERSNGDGTNRLAKAFGVNMAGHFDGDSWRISPRTEGNFVFAGVSADGLAAWSTAHLDLGDKMFIQPLRVANGLPDGVPFVVASSADNQVIYLGDITDELPNGLRIVVYGLATDSTFQYDIYAQAVNTHTRKKVGTKHLLHSAFLGTADLYQGITVSSHGGFVAFVESTNDCPYGMILYQAFDDHGNKVGSPKELTACTYPNSYQLSLDSMAAE